MLTYFTATIWNDILTFAYAKYLYYYDNFGTDRRAAPQAQRIQ